MWLARRKHGQRVWNPNASSHGAAPSTGITASEALQIAYRPMPLPQTVEYEEDFGDNLMIHREFISKKNREAMDFQLSSLAYSETELQRGRQHLATIMNRERAGAAVGMGGSSKDRVSMHYHSNDIVSDTSGTNSAHYLFSEERMQYCERFQRFFQHFERENALSKIHGNAVSSSDSSSQRGSTSNAPTGDTSPLFSLMEACAILYGCETREAQETYLQMFLGLSTERLEQDEAKIDETLRSQLVDQPSPTNTSSMVPDDVASSAAPSPLPSLFDDLEQSAAASPTATLRSLQRGAPLPHPLNHFNTNGGTLSHSNFTHNHKKPPNTYDISSIAQRTHIRERRRWRQLIEKLVGEHYDQLTPEDYGHAVILNHQLHTIKFFDLKIGDVVQQMISRMHQDQNAQHTSLHRTNALHSTPQHPETN